MKPVVLPMLHLLCVCEYCEPFRRDIRTITAAHAKHALELVLKDLNELGSSLSPVFENPFGAWAARQFRMSGYEILHDLDILTVEQGLKVDRFQVAALFGEVSSLVEDVGDAPAHACGKISSARTKNDHQPVRHIFATVIPNALDDCSRSGVSNRETLAGYAVEEGLTAGGAVQ